jgi:hypothetical protein
MIRVERMIDTGVSVDDAFPFINDAHHQTEISPSLRAVFDVGHAASGGVKAGFVYRLASGSLASVSCLRTPASCERRLGYP